jgi:hypothetical protein
MFPTSSGTVNGDGSGETIALVEAFHDPYLASDLNTFDQTYGLPAANLIVESRAGQVSNPSWDLEESLDVEWAHAIAPGAALLVVEAKSQSLQNMLTAVKAARKTPGVVTISMSWGFQEFAKEASYNSLFTTPARHRGITFLASSGDSGPQGGTIWPSVAPEVVSVGGTSLNLDTGGRYETETAWYDSSGGYSRFEPEPGYQRSVQASGKRSDPDVAFDGDPDTGVQVYQTSLYTGQGSWYMVGGTSLGSPAWAAIIAIADQGRALEGKGSLDGPTQTLPALYALPSTDFNLVAPLSAQQSTAANTSTGLGTPNGTALISDLVASTTSVPLTTTGIGAGGSSNSVLSRKKIKKAVAVFRSVPLLVARPKGVSGLGTGRK